MTNSQAWDYAIGMTKVDGLEPTEDFKKYVDRLFHRLFYRQGDLKTFDFPGPKAPKTTDSDSVISRFESL